MKRTQQMDLRDYIIQTQKHEITDLRAFNNYLRFMISELRKEALDQRSTLASRTDAEIEYDRRLEVIGGFITDLEAELASTYRDKKNTGTVSV